MKRSGASLVLDGLGALLLVVLLRTSTSQVLANRVTGIDTSTDGSIVAAQGTQAMTPRAYLPLVQKEWFKEYWYEDGFQDTGSGWPWGSNGFDYGYKTNADTTKVYHIEMDDEDDIVFLTGPQYAMGNFVYDVQLRRATQKQPLKWGDEYGILISPTPIDPENPFGASVYTFQIELKIGDDEDSFYSISKWSDLHDPTRDVLKRTAESEFITDLARFWNRLTITRTGSTLYFYLTRVEADHWMPWQHVYTHLDNTLPDTVYIGFYASHSGDDLGEYKIEFQFDNVSLHAYP